MHTSVAYRCLYTARLRNIWPATSNACPTSRHGDIYVQRQDHNRSYPPPAARHSVTVVACFFRHGVLKVKVSTYVWRLIAGNLLLKRSGEAARSSVVIVKGSHTFTCTLTRLSEAGTHFSSAKGWKAELAWATVSKQLAHDCYEMFIAAASRSKHHASLGKFSK